MSRRPVKIMLSTMITEDLRRRLDEEADRDETSISKVVRLALRSYFSRSNGTNHQQLEPEREDEPESEVA